MKLRSNGNQALIEKFLSKWCRHTTLEWSFVLVVHVNLALDLIEIKAVNGF